MASYLPQVGLRRHLRLDLPSPIKRSIRMFNITYYYYLHKGTPKIITVATKLIDKQTVLLGGKSYLLIAAHNTLSPAFFRCETSFTGPPPLQRACTGNSRGTHGDLLVVRSPEKSITYLVKEKPFFCVVKLSPQNPHPNLRNPLASIR